MSNADRKRRARERRRLIRDELLAKGVPPEELPARIDAIIRAGHEAAVRRDQEEAERRKLAPPDPAKLPKNLTPVQRWQILNPAPKYDPEPVYEQTYQAKRLDDSKHRAPAPPRASRKAGPRESAATSQAISRGKTLTKWEYDERFSSNV